MIELRRRYGSSAGGGQPSRLPAGYQEVEYLESRGDGAFIKTDVLYDSTKEYTIDTKFHILQRNSSQHLFGASKSGSHNSLFLAQNNNKGYLGFYNDSTNATSYIDSETSEGYDSSAICKFGRGGLLINSLSIYKNIGSKGFDSINEVNFLVFNAESGKTNTLYARFYTFTISLDGAKLCDLVPCYDNTTKVAGMYDIVNDVFYTNAGTGEFLVGPDVGVNTVLPTEYQRVEFIKTISDGNYNYIKTGLFLPNGFVVKTKFSVNNSLIASCIIGATENSSPYYRNAILVRNTGEVTLSAGTNAFGSNYYIELNSIYELEASTIKGESYLKIDGVTYVQSTNSDERTSKEIFLFANNYVERQQFHGSLSDTEIYDDLMTLVRNFIPCYRKADNVAGMYDIVEGKFYTNAGTGEFILGPDVIG